MNRKLIYDLGLHAGRDSEFYLKKGFNVVAVEANPILANSTSERLAEHVGSGQLTVIEKAIWDKGGEEVTFYVNDEKDDWSSLFRGAAEKGVTSSREIKVQTITLAEMYETYGVPYYLKCDLEGGDISVAWQLSAQTERPKYASFEVTSLEIISALRASGYTRFQLINQAFHYLTKLPNPPMEGEYVNAHFDGYTSGLFGRELDFNKWVDFEEVAGQYMDFDRLKRRNEILAMGWLDVHATDADG